jgi:hypothetical protein
MVEIKYCPSLEMIADYMTKPLSGSIFICFWRQVLGIIPIKDSRCVLENLKKDLNDVIAGHVKFPLKKKYV